MMDTAVELKRRRWTVAEYHRMVEAGILDEDSRVELIYGEIVEMSPISNPHQACVDRQTKMWVRVAGNQGIVRVQGSVRLDDEGEPQPDILILRHRDDYYASEPAGPQDVLLVIEVADSSLASDRQVKIPMYGRYGIPEAWLWDLNGQRLFVHRDPGPDGYQTIRIYRRGDAVRASAFPDHEIVVDEVLG